ncbi:Gp37-like protein [Paraoerskovia sediminicola]|uniref:Gp37-like protein n=1 Tax=Paraoerskovia sediminicola TaxID=1138587 RepID=UPI0025729B32|nr:hypothetical protein [Paraoerskovia sediminicola]
MSQWTSLTLVERFNQPDSWTLTGPSSALSVFEAGMGCILDRDGEQVTSGQVKTLQRSAQVDEDTGAVEDVMTVAFESDLGDVYSRRTYQDPTDEITTTETFDVAYDKRTGAAEDLILGYIASNLAPAAPIAGRRLTSLALPISLGRGGTQTVSARMDDLGDLVAPLAEAANLHITIRHDESTGTPRLLVVLEDVPDVSADVRFGPVNSAATGLVTGWGYTLERPAVTDVIVAAGGEGVARLYARYADPAARTLWGRRREGFIDQRQTDDIDEIAAAGEEALEDGATPVTTWFTVADSADVQYRRDYGVGYRVGVELPGLPDAVSDNVVREVTTTVDPTSERVSMVVGTPGATVNSTKQAQRLARANARLNLIERSK